MQLDCFVAAVIVVLLLGIAVVRRLTDRAQIVRGPHAKEVKARSSGTGVGTLLRSNALSVVRLCRQQCSTAIAGCFFDQNTSCPYMTQLSHVSVQVRDCLPVSKNDLKLSESKMIPIQRLPDC